MVTNALGTVEAIEAEIDRQDNFMLQHGWQEVGDTWKDPHGNICPYSDGYTRLTLSLLKEQGWRQITEIHHTGKKESKFHKVIEWGRYQSPVTKRIYTFLDAQYVMENEWNEDPKMCCEATIELSKLAGANFTGDTIETWFYIGEQGEHIHKLWD